MGNTKSSKNTKSTSKNTSSTKKTTNTKNTTSKKTTKPSTKTEEIKIKEPEIKEEKVDVSKEIMNEIDNSLKDDVIERKSIKRKHPIINFLSFILFVVGGLFFISNLFFNNKDSNNLFILVNSLLLVLFTICFIFSSVSNNKRMTGLGCILLIGYFTFNSLINMGYISLNTFNKVDNFSNMNLSQVIEWASKNKVTINEEYEYSDMVDEYNIISQSVKAGTNLKDVSSITVAVSDGPNPSKNIVIPNMVSWDSERVINFVLDNHLSNVNVDFVQSEEKQDTVIEQSYTGNMNRNDELNLTFSYGEELGYEEVKLIDFKNKSKFEVMFFCKQHQLNYEFKEGFSNTIKKGYAYKQSVKAGEVVQINSDPIKIYISRGPKIKVPDFKNYSLEDITKWVIKNRLKIKIVDSYDDSIKENNIIGTNYSKGDIVSQGDTIEVIVSRGSLKMKKFKNLDDFRAWADKYSIKYEIQYEFSNTVNIGEVISYSYKPGETIKNDDTIIVKVSDGKKIEVPNLKGLTKAEAIKKLKAVGLNYNFVTKSSDSVEAGKVISQSMSAGSEVSRNSTITVTISSGKNTQKKEVTPSNPGNNNNNNKNNYNPPPVTPPTPSCTTCTIDRGLYTVFNNNSGFNAVSSALYGYFASKCPGVKINVVGVEDTGKFSGSYVGGIKPNDTLSSCGGTYTIQIAK